VTHDGVVSWYRGRAECERTRHDGVVSRYIEEGQSVNQTMIVSFHFIEARLSVDDAGGQ